MKLNQKIGFSFLGFPFATFIIFIIYIFIYLIEGLAAYMNEIITLIDISNLIKEIVVLGIAFFISIFCLLSFFDVSTKKAKTKAGSVLLIIASLLLLVVGFALVPIIASSIFLSDMPTFTFVFFIVWLFVVAIFSLIQILKEFITKWVLVKKKPSTSNSEKTSN